MAREQAERWLPASTRTSQNVAVAAALLDVLPTPSTDGVGEVYHRLKSILGAVAMQEVESSLLHRVEASIILLADAKDGGHKATQGAPDAGTASSPEGFSTCDRPGRPSARTEPQTYQWHHPGDDGAQS
jgi:hypothetical protein